ncbi:TPA: hypothetical protein DEP21_04485 [Patescibacteria group bacterium]|nr:hypothetical protein [Candidatus Gracilibacteria bacterium]
MFLNLCKINYYLQQNGKDLRTDNPSLKHRLLRSMLQDSIVYSKNTKVSFGELYPFLTEKDLLDIVDMAYGAEEDI